MSAVPFETDDLAPDPDPLPGRTSNVFDPANAAALLVYAAGVVLALYWLAAA